MASQMSEHPGGTPAIVKDPVCGMDVDPRSAQHAEVDGVDHHFCSARCRAKFFADPTYRHGHVHQDGGGDPSHHGHGHHQGDTGVPAGAEVAEYTCPMHPEIR